MTGGTNFFFSRRGLGPGLFFKRPVFFLSFFVLWCGVVVYIGVLCLKSVRRGNLLPLLLFSSSGLPLMNGQFGPPTIVGFAVFTTGLALAARNLDDDVVPSTTRLTRQQPDRQIVRKRSAHAERIHQVS